MRAVEVRYRGRHDTLVARGARTDDVAGFRWGFEQDGREWHQTSFVLVDEGFLLARRSASRAADAGGGTATWSRSTTAGTPWRSRTSVDVLVGPPTTPYRLLDLDELAAAVTAGDVAPATALAGLSTVQWFLDRRLNRCHDISPTWPEFPPPALTAPGWADLPDDWHWT